MRKIVHTDNAPAAVGPYSQAVIAHGFVFCSGQIGLDPSTGEFAGEDIESQTRQVFANIKAVLAAAGTSLENVIKTTVFMADMADYKAMNAIYSEFFPKDAPARSAVAVTDLPLGSLVEIEIIALVP